MTKKFIFIPVVNNFHLLEKAVKSVKQNLFNEYIIFNNSSTDIPENIYNSTQFKIYQPDTRKTFMQTQNIMRKYAIDNNFDYYCFMHNDGEIIDDTDIRLIKKADEIINTNWGIIFTHYDVLCVFKTKMTINIGEWGDNEWLKEQQSGYYLDCDYYRRIKLLKYNIIELGGKGVLHNEQSNTIKEKKELDFWQKQSLIVKNHYIKKWGGTPGNEIFTKPFNK